MLEWLRRACCCWLVMLGAGHWTSSAHAAAPAAEASSRGRSSEPAPLAMTSRWYGWQNLTADGVALALVVGGAALAEDRSIPGALSGTVLGLGVATYALGGPVIHFGHGNPGRGVLSLGLRTLLPVGLGVGTVQAMCSPHSDFCGIVAIPAALVGIVAAVTLDAAAIARDEVPASPRSSSRTLGFSLRPSLHYDTRRASIGVAGTF